MDHDAFLDQFFGQQPAHEQQPDHFLFDGLGDLGELDFAIQRHFGHIPPQEDINKIQEMPVVRRSQGDVDPELSTEACEEAARNFFPDICPDYLRNIAKSQTWTAQGIIEHILDQQENGNKYPKRSKSLKRKRANSHEDIEEELRKKFEAEPRHQGKPPEYFKKYKAAARSLLVAEFPDFRVKNIEEQLRRRNHSVYPTYLTLDTEFVQERSDWRKKSTTKTKQTISEIVKAFSESSEDGEKGALEEFKTARGVCEAKAAKARAKKAEEAEEAANYTRAEADGTIVECGCCFGDFPQNRMVHCSAETIHFFCCKCAKRMAETQVGLSKYQLDCMSMDGCQGTFNKSQKDLFLDEKLTLALDRIEQEAVLRIAGLESLETCPFCPYAAEYPPVELNKEFKCVSEECGVISCRLCRQETHIPKSCEEVARENGHSARRVIEEAMSAAMIRTCNKCKTPFIKENGCNKMTCTRNGCGNMQCYVCSKSCDYTHFDDAARGGKRGNCPLFDSVEQRHAQEVREAEEAARKRVAEANPDVDASLLNIQFSDKVKEDESKRTAANPVPRRMPAGFQVPPQIPVLPQQAPIVVHPPAGAVPAPVANHVEEMNRRMEMQRMHIRQQLNLDVEMEQQRVARRNMERVRQAGEAVHAGAMARVHAEAERVRLQQVEVARREVEMHAALIQQVHEAQRAQQGDDARAELERVAAQRARAIQQMQHRQQQQMAAQLNRFPQGAPFPAVPRPFDPAQVIPGALFAPAGAAGGLFEVRSPYLQGVQNPPQAVQAQNPPAPKIAQVANNSNANNAGVVHGQRNERGARANGVIDLTGSPPAPPGNNNQQRGQPYIPGW
ncbi:putative E3 ubiquitin-protein ligase [Triangularia setosa]|uniref:E3 ubiquitin-protein ligase n=1 Tax=Triangularia setosa TaxID=2587417 RepID=A0AAN6W298_9PEZI|nr:putative E3 ubiquitin-protein ligase [Podospora setosa]